MTIAKSIAKTWQVRNQREKQLLYVESLIVEVSADKATEFGVQWAGVSGDSGSNMRVGLLTGFSSDGNNLVSQA